MPHTTASAAFPAHPTSYFPMHPNAAGTYSLGVNNTKCTECAAGTASYVLGRGTVCPPCPLNTFARYSGEVMCR